MLRATFAGLLAGLIFARNASAAESTCFGTTSSGRLEHGVQLPVDGSNFQAYSILAHTLGRTYVHSEVAEIVLAAYTALATAAPGKFSLSY